MTRNVAVIGIGKTNAKLVLVDATDLTEIEVLTRPNTVLPGPPWPRRSWITNIPARMPWHEPMRRFARHSARPDRHGSRAA